VTGICLWAKPQLLLATRFATTRAAHLRRWSNHCLRGSATAEGNEIDEDVTMLRITVHKNSQTTRLQLEGRLAGAWVEELVECWQRTLKSERQPNIEVDLTGLISIDRKGKAYLAAMYRQGAEFIVADCETKSIVDEIVSKSVSESRRLKL
jgi:ABC-type transporter Mla MlaB component